MRRAAVLLAALVVLTGCGTDTPDRDDAATSTADASPSPTEDESMKDEPAKDEQNDESKDEPADEPEPAATVPADAPACATVWRDGTKLARDYDGCMAGGEFVAVDQEPCSFGQRLVRFGNHFYAVRGGPVNRTAVPLSKDRNYRSAIASCRA